MIIDVKDLTKIYKKPTIALNNVNLQMKEGEILGILGPNGSGKTTFINCILGLLSYDKGSIKLFGETNLNKIKSKIGIVPQDLALFNDLSVKENIDFFCSLYIKNKKERKILVEEAINFTKLNGHENKSVKNLSGGLKRRLNIACGISHKPKLIFLDEPTVAIDPQSRNFILDGLKEMNKQGVSIVYTTHYMEEAEILCDRIAIMDIANILTIGTKQEIMKYANINSILKIDIASKEFIMPTGIRFIKNNEYILEEENTLNILIDKLKNENVNYTILEISKPTLNDIFLLLTGRKLRDE